MNPSQFLISSFVNIDGANTFINPSPAGGFPSDLRFPIGSNQTIQWSTNFTDVVLYLIQDSGVSGDGRRIDSSHAERLFGDQDTSYFNWRVNTTLDYLDAPQFCFTLCNGTGPNATSFSSLYFNITLPPTLTARSPDTPDTPDISDTPDLPGTLGLPETSEIPEIPESTAKITSKTTNISSTAFSTKSSTTSTSKSTSKSSTLVNTSNSRSTTTKHFAILTTSEALAYTSAYAPPSIHVTSTPPYSTSPTSTIIPPSSTYILNSFTAESETVDSSALSYSEIPSSIQTSAAPISTTPPSSFLSSPTHSSTIFTTSSPTISPQESHNGLSAGGKAGIGITTSLIIIAFAVAAWERYRPRNRIAPGKFYEMDAASFNDMGDLEDRVMEEKAPELPYKPEVYVPERPGSTRDRKELFELEGDGGRVELAES